MQSLVEIMTNFGVALLLLACQIQSLVVDNMTNFGIGFAATNLPDAVIRREHD